MLNSIPLYCLEKARPSFRTVGSGFCYRGKHGIWLITAAHIGLNTKPHEDWSKWADQLFVDLPSPRDFSTLLFDGGAPRFQHLPHVGDNQLKPDVIAVPISEANWATLTADYRLFTEDDIGQVATGDGVVGQGYPGGNGLWPGPMQTFKATAEPLRFRIRFDFDMGGGFSGGPLTDLNGKIVGVLDSTDDSLRGYAWDFNFVRLLSDL